MFKRILVVFENEKICEKALNYSRELALRMDSEISFLMLVEMAFINHSLLGSKRKAIEGIETRLGTKLGELSSEFLKKGITVSTAIRVGELAQELMKFLAERMPFQAIIWGSHEELPRPEGPSQSHWIRKVTGTLECPLFTVSSKIQPGNDRSLRQ